MAPRIHVYRTYRWIDKDPIIDAVKTCVQETHLNYNQVANISGVANATLANWFDGDTRRPNNATVSAVTSALGYVRRDSLARDGSLQVGYVKAREYDYKDEITKAADWLLKEQRKKPRKKKPNGGASK